MKNQVGWLKVSFVGSYTLPETNSEFTPDKLMLGRLLFLFWEGRFFKCYVLFLGTNKGCEMLRFSGRFAGGTPVLGLKCVVSPCSGVHLDKGYIFGSKR